MTNEKNLLEVKNLKQYFSIPNGFLKSLTLRLLTTFLSILKKAKHLALLVNRVVVKPQSAEVFYNFINQQQAKFGLMVKKLNLKKALPILEKRLKWFSKIHILH